MGHHVKLYRSFKYAFSGISQVIVSETNFKIGLIEAMIIIAAAFYFDISRYEWILVFIMIGMVLTAELFNTSIETIVDSFTSEQHPGAKLAKDISSGAVVMLIIFVAIAGMIIFLPYLLKYLAVG